MNKAIQRNYKICTLDKHLDCTSCSIAHNVDCSRHKPQQMTRYYKMLAIYVIPAILILGLSSFILKLWWLLPGYIAYWVFYQIVGELFIRCRHCPFWDESNPRLDCRINCGVPKLQWLTPASLVRFNPGPLVLWEKIVVQVLSILTILIPLVVAVVVIVKQFSIDGNMNVAQLLIYLFAVCQLVTGVIFIRYLTGKLCPTCVHFSCPNNRQPYQVIDSFLAKNKTMQEAWEKHLHTYKNRK